MQFQYISYIWPLIISAMTSLSLGIYVLLMRRNTKGMISFMLSIFVATIWSLSNALEMSAVDLSSKLFWANMQYFAYGYFPVTLLALCMEFTGHDEWIKSKRILWLAIMPTIIIILVWTDSFHGLIRYGIHLDYSGPFPVISKKFGPVFYIHAVYSHFLSITAWLLVIKAVFIKNTAYRKQAVALFFGMSLIIIPSLLYILGIGPVKKFDITPVFFGPAGIIITWGIYRYRLFDLIPLARAKVIETMDVGMMVTDLQNWVLDVNPAFERIVGLPISKISGKSVEEACSKIPELVRACIDRSINQTEFSIKKKENMNVYEALLSFLTDSGGVSIGRLVVIYEITKKKQAQQEFLRQQRRFAVIEERERMARDMHDNLGQVLGFINLQAQGIRQEQINSGIEIAAEKLDKLINAAQSAHDEIREYIRDARNIAALEKGFTAVMKRDITTFEEQTGIHVERDIPPEFTGEELEPNVLLNLLNIIREALNNVRKHAKASYVKITFLTHQEELCVTVEDDGKGFEVIQNDRSINSQFGLHIMRERALEIGAKVDIKSTLGKGSKVIFCLPLRKEEKNEY